MMQHPRVIAIVALCCATAAFDSATAEMRQFSCELDNNYVAFVLREASEMGTVGARNYIVDFQQHGPTIRLPPTYYAPDWSDIEEIRFEHLGGEDAGYGRLSLRIRSAQEPTYTQQIGIVQRTCWNAAKGFLGSRGITVRTSEVETVR
jgi:hypothetical protein